MSRSFEVLFSSPNGNLPELVSRCIRLFQVLGFRVGPDVSRLFLVDPENERRHEHEKVNISLNSRFVADLADWKDATFTFWSSEFTLYAVLTRWAESYSNCCISTSASRFRELFREDRIGRYYEILQEIGAACSSPGGIGGIDLDYYDITPESIRVDMLSHDENKGFLAPFGIIDKSICSSSALRQQLGAEYRILELAHYWVIEEEGLSTGSG